MKKIRVGLIGGGGVAQWAHIANYKKYSDHIELVAIADVSEAVLQRNKENHGFQHTFTDYNEMLANVELDAVSVCTPNLFHAPATIAALKAGCHVMCEKPPAMTAAEAIAMEEAARQSGKILTYGFMYRYTSQAQILRRFIDAGEMGSIYAGRITAMRRSGIPARGVFINKELQGGGPLIDIGVHMLDLALYLMGYPRATQVMGVTYRELGTRPMTPMGGTQWDYQNYTVEDMAMAMIKFENGASLQLETSFIVHTQEKEIMNVKLHGTEGGCNFSPLAMFQDKHGTLIDITPAHIPERSGHQMEIEAFIKAIQGEGDVLCKPSEGVIVQQIIESIYRSAETGQVVNI